MLFEAGDPESLELAEKAYQAAPDNPLVLDTLGWILLHYKQSSRSIKLLEEAYKLAPENKEIRAHLEAARKAG
jgi:tetratricopeptide (TPR) repeat protein